MTAIRAYTVCAALLFAGLLGACATSGGGSSSGGSRNLITLEQLEEQPDGTLFDVIQRLRPRWLQGRGVTSVRSSAPTPPQVYLDRAPMGSVGSLRSISVTDVERVQFMSGTDATTRFGTNHEGGAILVTTRSGR